MTPVMASLAELIRRTEEYKDNYQWFVELAKNFHWIQSQMVDSVDKVTLNSPFLYCNDFLLYFINTFKNERFLQNKIEKEHWESFFSEHNLSMDRKMLCLAIASDLSNGIKFLSLAFILMDATFNV